MSKTASIELFDAVNRVSVLSKALLYEENLAQRYINLHFNIENIRKKLYNVY